MKTRFLIIIGIVSAVIFPSLAYGLVMPMTTQEVLDEFDLILVGTVTDTKQLEGKAPVYTIEIEEIVKKPDSFETSKSVSVTGCNSNNGHIGTPCTSYEVGDRGLFLLVPSNDDYEISYYSQIAEPHCTSEQFLANYIGFEYEQGLSQDGQSKMFFTGKPIDLQYTVFNRDLTEKDYSITLSVSVNDFNFSDVVNGTISDCVGHVTVSSSFISKEMGPSWLWFEYDGESTGGSGPAIIDYGSTPYKQYKAGIRSQETWCKEGLILVLMKDDTPNLVFDNKPACVKPNTVSKLAERNIVELSSFYQNRPLIERLYAGMAILQLSDIPITVMGLYDNDQILEIQIDDKELNKMPDAQDYYDRIIRETISFNVPMKITFG